MWIHASEQSPPPTCASVYVHVMKRSTREWLSSFPETNGRRGEKNLSHRIVAILSFFRSCGCTMRYSLICRLYALCNSQSYSKHVVKVTWLTWLKITKRNVFFSIIIWPILKTMSTKDILTVQSAIEYQTHSQSVCIYVHNSAYIHGLSLTHMLYILELTREKKKKHTNSLNAPLVSLAARRNTVQFFFHYLGIPICWMFKRKSTGKLNFNGVWISRWQTNWGREWLHGQKIPNNSNCVHTTWHTPHTHTHTLPLSLQKSRWNIFWHFTNQAHFHLSGAVMDDSTLFRRRSLG